MNLILKQRFPIIQQIKFFHFIALLALGVSALAGCTPQMTSTAVVPLTGQEADTARAIQYTEIALVEQSTDNPTHISFQDRVVQVMAARQSSWHMPGPQEALDDANRSLAPFGYRLTVNPNPPFSSYALFHVDRLIQADISRFWPVSIENGESDFLLAYQTSAGERWMASSRGLQTWPDQGQNTPPAYYGSEIAYAVTGADSVNVYAGSGIVYTGQPDTSVSEKNSQNGSTGARKFVTWSDGDVEGMAPDNHWALEVGNNIILDGQDLAKTKKYDAVFGLFIINGQPLYFYTQKGLTHINYAGKDSPYTYDLVVHQNEGPTEIFNPSANANTAWFYALRDGVWYYVEAGVKQ